MAGPAICTSVTELGIGDYDQQKRVIQYGPVGQEERIGMRWMLDFLPSPSWVSDPEDSIIWNNSWIMEAIGDPFAAYWGYTNKPTGNPGQFGQSSYGWCPQAIRHASSAFSTGLQLQERLTTDFWLFDAGDVMELATVWYPMGSGDQISNINDPSPYIGTTIAATPTRRIFTTTGWKISGIQTASRPNLAPHLYCHRDVANFADYLEFFFAEWRWVGTP